MRDIRGERGAQLLERDLGSERIDVWQLCGRTGDAESAREFAVTRQQCDCGAARHEMQRDINAGESRTNHQDVRGPARSESRQRPGCPWIHHNLAVGPRRQHRSEGAFQRVGHAAVRTPGREHDTIGR